MPSVFLNADGSLVLNGDGSVMYDETCCCGQCCQPSQYPAKVDGAIIGGGPMDGSDVPFTPTAGPGESPYYGSLLLSLCGLDYLFLGAFGCNKSDAHPLGVWGANGGINLGAATKAGWTGTLASTSCDPFEVVFDCIWFDEGDTAGFNTLVACTGATFQIRFLPW